MVSLFTHEPQSPDIEDLLGHRVLILSPYKEQCNELRRQLKWALQNAMPEFGNIPPVSTVDKVQGSECRIVILDFVPAHCNALGFLKTWNRLNVAFTRAKDVFWIVGNLKVLREQLVLIAKGFNCKKLALALIYYLDEGLVINVDTVNSLPFSQKSRRDDQRSAWINTIARPPRKLTDFSEKQVILNRQYHEHDTRIAYEKKLVDLLNGYRAHAAELKARYENGDVFENEIFQESVHDAPVFDKNAGNDEGDEPEDDNLDHAAPMSEKAKGKQPATEVVEETLDTAMGSIDEAWMRSLRGILIRQYRSP